MKTTHELQQEIGRLRDLLPGLVREQPGEAEEIIKFHIANLAAAAAPSDLRIVQAARAELLSLAEKARAH
ncbi:MAG TPA: hypothetical protein DDZ67_12180 [Xanthomonadaceae bacterium]|nr:hypothetical protein [Xanthomonadaceae bacterium]